LTQTTPILPPLERKLGPIMYPLFVFDKTKFPNWAGGTSAGKKHHSNHTPNTADKNQYYTIVAASDE
jgi:hypothetical protein